MGRDMIEYVFSFFVYELQCSAVPCSAVGAHVPMWADMCHTKRSQIWIVIGAGSDSVYIQNRLCKFYKFSCYKVVFEICVCLSKFGEFLFNFNVFLPFTRKSGVQKIRPGLVPHGL